MPIQLQIAEITVIPDNGQDVQSNISTALRMAGRYGGPDGVIVTFVFNDVTINVNKASDPDVVLEDYYAKRRK